MKVKSWTLSMNQEVVPVYGNGSGMEPLYLRVGLVDYSLDVESYDAIGSGDSDEVTIESDTFTLTGKTSEKGYQFNGITDLGTYRYTFVTGTNTGASDGVVIS